MFPPPINTYPLLPIPSTRGVFWGKRMGMGDDVVADGLNSSPTKARDFEGPGGPETKQQLYEEANPGNDDVRDNIRQGGETRRP